MNGARGLAITRAKLLNLTYELDILWQLVENEKVAGEIAMLSLEVGNLITKSTRRQAHTPTHTMNEVGDHHCGGCGGCENHEEGSE